MNKKQFFLILVLTLATLSVVHAQDLEDIQWVTENYPPYSYSDEKGIAQGIAVDILIKLWDKVGLKRTRKDIVFRPWARGIYNLANDKNTCLFSMTITDERKEKFKFVGQVVGETQVLLAKKEKNYQFNSIEEINQSNEKMRVGAVLGDIGEKAFLQIGGSPSLLNFALNVSQLVDMLIADHLHLVAYEEASLYESLIKKGFDYQDFEVVLPIISSDWGFAFNREVNPKTLTTLQNAFNELVEEGYIEQIKQAHYLSRISND